MQLKIFFDNNKFSVFQELTNWFFTSVKQWFVFKTNLLKLKNLETVVKYMIGKKIDNIMSLKTKLEEVCCAFLEIANDVKYI